MNTDFNQLCGLCMEIKRKNSYLSAVAAQNLAATDMQVSGSQEQWQDGLLLFIIIK